MVIPNLRDSFYFPEAITKRFVHSNRLLYNIKLIIYQNFDMN